MKIKYIHQSVTVFFLMISMPLLAAATEPESFQNYMQSYIMEAPETTTEFPVSDEPDDLALQQTINQYTEHVLQLEIQDGAYANDLSEALVGLGLAYSAFGNHQGALNAYSRALHINRINEGLQSLSQLPILELVIQANTALGDYTTLSDNFGYLLWVYNRNHEKDDPALIPVLERIANWHLDAYDVTTPPESTSHIIMATNLFSRVVEIIETSHGPYSADLINPLYGIVNANFKLIEPFGFIPNVDSFIGARLSPLLPTDFDRSTPGRRVTSNNHMVLNYEQAQLNRILEDQKNSASLIQNSYRSGRNALERIIDIHIKNPDLPRLSHAYAHTHLADWYIRFYKRSSAAANYESAYQLLVEDGYPVEGEKGFFSYPRSLDRFRNPQRSDSSITSRRATLNLEGEPGSDIDENQPPWQQPENDTNFVLVQFNVSEHGTIRNLDIIEANPADNVRFRRMARNMISATPFRPRMENGKPTVTENVRMLYRFE